jgi:hypothetical protein
MRTCPTCQGTTPAGNYCVRCGAPLDRELDKCRQRPRYAAAPGEHRYAPWLVSTLFPHLPRHSERHFHIALATGVAVVIVLGALRLFPVALITAALLMPLLTLLYFYDVDIYEREPWWAAAWTLLWGAITGVGVGLSAKAVAPTGPALIDRGSTSHVVTGGVLLPALGVLLMFAGPLVLLGNERFNDALDGATFGSITAATFAAAEAVVVGAGVLGGGLRPAGGGAAVGRAAGGARDRHARAFDECHRCRLRGPMAAISGAREGPNRARPRGTRSTPSDDPRRPARGGGGGGDRARGPMRQLRCSNGQTYVLRQLRHFTKSTAQVPTGGRAWFVRGTARS